MRDLLKEFLELTAFSVPSKHETKIRECLKNKLLALGFEVSLDNVFSDTDSGNLYGFLSGEGEPILFACHMDTVTPCANKNIVVEESGLIHTDETTILGADDVSGIAEFFAAVRKLRNEGISHRPVEVVFTASEEYFVEGAKNLDYSRIRSKMAYILDTDGEIGRAVLAAPTGVRVIAEITGKAAHAALKPEEGVNAIEIASEAISNMNLGRIDENTTANIGIIRGGCSGNVVPETCFVEGETRSLCHKSALKQKAHMEQCFMDAAEKFGGKCCITSTIVYDAWNVEEAHPLCRRFRHACEKAGVKPFFERACGGSDASFLSAHNIDCLVLATGMHEIHSVREYTTLHEMLTMAEVVYQLMVL